MIKNKTLLAWLCVFVSAISVYAYLSFLQVDKDSLYFGVIITITLCLWVFAVVPDFIPSLLALLLILLLGLAPSDAVMSGFSSQGFLLAFSILGLGAVIAQSGLTKRYTLWMLDKLPANSFVHQLAVFMTGTLFTPIIPTITGRVVIVAPVLSHLVQGWDKHTKQRGSTAVYSAGLDSTAYLSPIFLTAAPANLMVFGLLSVQDQYVYDYMFWLYAASLTGLIMLLLYVLLLFVFFRSYHSVRLDKAEIHEARQALGRPTIREYVSILSIILLGVGIATTSIHKIPVAYLAFFIFVSLLMMGALSREEFINKIDWSFLFMLAGIIGILTTMRHLGIDDQIMQQLSGLGHYMRDNFALFVFYLSLAVLVVRLIIPLNSAILIFAAALMPIAEAVGVSAWLVGFIILIFAETAFFPHQSPYISVYQRMVDSHIDHQEWRVQLFHFLLIMVKLAAIYLSMPFWLSIGVL